MCDERFEFYKKYLKRQGFELEGEPLGSGYSGTVWCARQPSLGNRRVAVKFGDTMNANRNAAVLSRFRREANILAKCQHPRIPYVMTHGIVEDVNVPYVVMSYVDGERLSEYMAREGRSDVVKALEIMLPVIEALDWVHRHDVIHRDVTPNNIMLSDNGVMLIDFSIGLDSQHSEKVTREGQGLGTTDYAAPEQLRNAKDVKFSADVYSAAIIVYELITGHRQFDSAIAKRFELPEQLASILARAMDGNPSVRPVNGRELLDELNDFMCEPRATWSGQVEVALCKNVKCWEWNDYDSGEWEPMYYSNSRHKHCYGCGVELLRQCPGCQGNLTKTRHCGACGENFYKVPLCKKCGGELSKHENVEVEAGRLEGCWSCQPKNEDWDDIPF